MELDKAIQWNDTGVTEYEKYKYVPEVSVNMK